MAMDAPDFDYRFIMGLGSPPLPHRISRMRPIVDEESRNHVVL